MPPEILLPVLTWSLCWCDSCQPGSQARTRHPYRRVLGWLPRLAITPTTPIQHRKISCSVLRPSNVSCPGVCISNFYCRICTTYVQLELEFTFANEQRDRNSGILCNVFHFLGTNFVKGGMTVLDGKTAWHD